MNVAFSELVLSKVSIVESPVFRQRSGFGRAGVTMGLVLLQEVFPREQGALGDNLAGDIAGIEAVPIERFGEMRQGEPLK